MNDLMAHCNHWFLLVLILHLPFCHSWGWFFSSEGTYTDANSKRVVAEFSMEPINNQKGMKLLENAKKMEVSSNSCWQTAYQNLFAGCSEILASEEKRSRLAWHLSDCFQIDFGRPPFPRCDVKSSMTSCLQKLDEDARDIYLEFYLETNSICHQLQADIFKRQMERLVNELKMTSENAEIAIENIEGRAEHILDNSNEIQNSLASIDHQTQQLAQTLRNVEDHASIVLKHSEAVYEQSVGIASSQSELLEGQGKMKNKMVEGMTMLHESFDNLGSEIDVLKHEAVEIEDDISKMGNAMYLKMNSLQSKADDIGNVTQISLDKQNKLLDGQSVALESVQLLTKFMSKSLEESRGTVEQVAEIGHMQQKELLSRQKQLEQAHGRLIQNSKTILAAQEDFESKQSTMFLAIDKLFALHNAILLESRLIKAFIVYFVSIFIIYMFTSTKKTYTVRPSLYMGLCVTFMSEIVLPKYVTNDIEKQTWIISMVRLLFVLLAMAQLVYTIYTYRDYEALNHQMLLTLIDKVDGMQRNEELCWDTDNEVEDWSSWINTDLPEDVDELEDPSYVFPGEIGEKSIITRRYSFRNRHLW